MPMRTGAPFFLFEKRSYGLANLPCARRPVFNWLIVDASEYFDFNRPRGTIHHIKPNIRS
jgi:hypothetical protein